MTRFAPFHTHIRDGYRLKRIKAWLEMPTEETEDRATAGHARRFRSVIVNYADDFVVLGKAVDGIRDSGYADGGPVDDDEAETADE